MSEHLLGQFRGVMVLQSSEKAVDNRDGSLVVADNHTRAVASAFTTSPFMEAVEDAANNEDDERELLRLLDELNHRIRHEDEVDALEPPSGSFVVEEKDAPTLHAGHAAPPVYSPPAPTGGSPFLYAAGASHVAKPPPPSFAEAVATSPPISAVPMELSPLAAHYVPPMTAVQQEPILLRNTHGVFMLRPIPKPTPPYTPPSLASSISPPPRYALPTETHTQSQPYFLGSSMAQVGGLADGHPAKNSVGTPYDASHSMNNVLGGSHILGGSSAGTYTYISTSVKSKPTGHKPPPPPYPS
ncbi:hypothetical protein TraAM80_03051 [Trypanosoma rangeli]|uniref:Uncharacterized protein n=1 Tax=Trypanosoma rangeli TaxID=5698 RepID=A0A422NRT2_TRYRA|nr:uncharacterized protein TraAM80_03051 [Trypanosoma rangeli]RNF08195.1 hypothetical protein TraAM80_03051 [Trypanosoma rangeli]|eukprot:RNF08195.1 hypothetical protein TraAM80_03051 [Trypanosoma rangeli]